MGTDRAGIITEVFAPAKSFQSKKAEKTEVEQYWFWIVMKRLRI